MQSHNDLPASTGPVPGPEPGRGDEVRLGLVLRAFAAAPVDADTPHLVISQAVVATGSEGGVVCCLRGDRVVVVASEGYTPDQRSSCGDLRIGDLSLPLTYAATTGEPVWLVSQADTSARFPRIVDLVPRRERAYAALPLRANGASLGVLGISFVRSHDFSEADKNFLLALADVCALHLQQWNGASGHGGRGPSTASLGRLIRALSRAETADEVARVIAEEGAVATAATFANIAVLDPGAQGPAARLFHASTLSDDVAQRYTTIPVDDTTPLGVALTSGQDVWLNSLSDVETHYPHLVEDTLAAGLSSTASLPLVGRGQQVIGAMGLGWAQPRSFSDTDQDHLRVVAHLAADALGRAQQLETERTARRRTERLQRTLSALVASASLTEVTTAVFEHGLPAFGASAARLALLGQQRPPDLVALDSVGLAPSVIQEWQGLPATTSTPSREAITTAAITYVPTRDELAARYPEASDVLSRSGHQAWLALPLRSGGRSLGVLMLLFPQPHPLTDTHDQIALTALSSAIADALSRAIQHDSDHDVVVSVQRSLLPHVLPDRPQIRLGARYLPAEARYGIGGDWYDAVPLSDGRLLVMVGDIAGHGLNAAITMGQMRSAARALAPTHGPAALLESLDRFLSGTLEASIATVAVVVIDPIGQTLRYSLAGHPPPLLRGPDATVRALDQAKGAVLGLETDDARPEHDLPFGAGSSLVLFTDGLVERRDETLDVGFARLTAALQTASVSTPDDLCDVLVECSLPATGRTDDTAVLCVFLAAPADPVGPTGGRQ